MSSEVTKPVQHAPSQDKARVLWNEFCQVQYHSKYFQI